MQLINKTNQFNLTTRRYREDEVVEAMAAPDTMTLQIRLADKFADHGMIAVIMGKKVEDRLEIDTWLMSCRVLGRGVEEACGNLVMEHAHRMGASSVTGLYKPTAKNEMVAQHYAKLGFEKVREYENGETRWILSVSGYVPRPTHIEVNEG